ncbi:MAG: histidine kinase dimerization/phosphoacceptor domain -containing protein [Ferruginibacter sp.]
MQGKTTILLLVTIHCLTSIVFSQQNNNDSLRQILESGQVKKMQFDQLFKIQSENQKLPKELAIGFSEALMNRKDLMAIDSFKCKAYLQAGSIYSKYGEFTKAENVFNQSLSIALSNNYQPLLISIYNAFGLYYARNNKDSLAIDYYTRSISTAEQLNETKEVTKTYVNITSLFLKRALLDKCISYGLNGLPIAEKGNNYRPLAGLSINIGTAYYRKKDYPSAIIYFRKSINAASRIRDQEKMISAFANLCSVYTILDQKDSATLYSNETETLLDKMDSPNELVQSNSILAKYNVTYGNYKKAITYAQKALEISKRAGIESLNGQDAYLVLYQAYKALNNKDSALSSFERYWALNEPRLLHEKDKAVVAVEQQFQQFKKEHEISLLKKDKAIGVTQRNSAILVALLLAIAAFLFYNRFRIKKRSSDALAKKNQEIEQQKALIQVSLGEKETLLREIHHRVKNNLQIISSLLNIQSEHISDEHVLSSIQEGQSRVEAMSLIHQNLYQSEHMNNVDINNYLQQLVAYLSAVFSGERRSIQVKVETAHLSFDIDTAIPLGLIVNELVSNAYKYAFGENSGGHINISIHAVNDVDHELKVEDDGRGLPAGFDMENSNSLGLKLVKILSRQLRGSFSASSGKGAVFLVKFKDLRTYQAT